MSHCVIFECFGIFALSSSVPHPILVCLFLRPCLIKPRLASNQLCSLGCPDPPSSASPVMASQSCTRRLTSSSQPGLPSHTGLARVQKLFLCLQAHQLPPAPTSSAHSAASLLRVSFAHLTDGALGLQEGRELSLKIRFWSDS